MRKAALDRYPEVAGGLNEQDCTHVILTKKEYKELQRRIAVAELDRNETQRRCEREIREAQSQAAYDIRTEREAAGKKIAEIEKELTAAREEVRYQTDANKDLWQRIKERANSDRDMRPKKEHTGYAVIYSAEKEQKYKRDRNRWALALLWETVLQSPYSIDFTEEQARRQIWEDLFKVDENNAWMIGNIGINDDFSGLYENIISDPDWEQRYSVNNVLMLSYVRLRANYKTMYWEAVVTHTKPLSVVPENMRLPPKK